MHSAFNEISIIIAIGTGIALVMRLLKQPLIIGHILTGILVGPSLLNLVHSEETFTVFTELGITLLLFIIGLGLNPKVIKEIGKVAIAVGSLQVGVTTIAGYFAAMAMGYSSQEAGFIGLALAFSSTIIILKLISDKKEQTRLYAKISIGLLIIQDILATLALLFLSTSAEGSVSASDLGLLLAKGAGLVVAMWFVATHVLPRMRNIIAGSTEFLFIFALGWGLGIATLFDYLNFSLEVGALFAGVGLATQVYTQEISARLRPLRDFFIVVFFVNLGAGFALDDVSSVVIPGILLSLLVIVVNPLVIFLSLGLMGYTKQTSFKTAIGMAQISEFSLVFAILANRQGRLSDEVLMILTLVAFITIAVSTYLIIYANTLYSFVEDKLSMFERRKVHYDQSEAGSYPIVLFGYKKGGAEFVKIFKTMRKKFVIVDYDPDVIDELDHQKLHYLYGDSTDAELLDEINIETSKLVVSTLTSHDINKFLVTHVHAVNDKAVIICQSDTLEEARELYERGASYVILTHSIGSERIGSFLKRNGFNRTEFKKYREKHLSAIESQINDKTQLD